MRHFLNFAAAALAAVLLSPGVRAQEAIRTIEVGLLSTTHVIFMSDLTYVDVSKTELVSARVVDASKNILALKARTEFALQTTISALEANGTMHTFYVRFNSTPERLLIDTRTQETSGVAQVNTQIRPEQAPSYAASSPSPQAGSAPAASAYQAGQYRQEAPQASGSSGKKGRRGKDRAGDGGASAAPQGGLSVTTGQSSNFGRSNAPTLEEVMRMERGMFHVVDKVYNVEASIVNIFSYSDVMYIVISLENKSDIGYEAGDAQFTIENRKVSSKTLSTDKTVWTKSSFGTLSCAPNSKTMLGYTIPKQTLQKNEVLKVYIYEKGGTRNLFLSLSDKDVNYASAPGAVR